MCGYGGIVTVKITGVFPHSRAEACGIQTGDMLVSINGHEINDVLDYRFYLAERKLALSVIREKNELSFEIKKGEYDDIGLEFETPLMDRKHRCENKCIFCFIDQLPKGMRDTLYFKDDDSRLSFLHGNYITLTNLSDHDIDRIKEMHISPVNVSVHTTNPELRVKMMKNKRAGEVLKYMKELADGGITLRGQIVLCKGINDGDELQRTMRDLEALYPHMDSVSIVTAGITGFRRGLYPLESFTPDDCRDIIAQVTAFADECEKKYGERIFYAADEIYVKGGVPLPPYEKWGEFNQIENGVGMLSSFEHEFAIALSMLDDEERFIHRKVSVATGEAAYAFFCTLAERIARECPNLRINVYNIKNNFFGGEITVTGLLTGVDLADQLAGEDLGDELLLSRTMLRAEGDMFLCNMTPAELSEKLGCRIRFIENDGGAFVDGVLGIGENV